MPRAFARPRLAQASPHCYNECLGVRTMRKRNRVDFFIKAGGFIRVRYRFVSWACVFVLFSGVVSRAVAEPFSYDGYKVVHVTVSNRQEAALLESLKLDIWSCSAGSGIGQVPVLVSPDQLAQLERTGLPVTTWIDDVGARVSIQRQRVRGATFHEAYHTLAEIDAEIQQYAVTYPAIAQTVNLGTSVEGRTIRGIRITGPGNGPDKPGLFIHGGQHAREWIGPAVMVYIADWLLSNYGTDATATRLVDGLEWFILPVMNPDGYEYSWTTFRMWRKNRRNNGNGTFGVDLNRNWGYQWADGDGQSTDPGNDTYRGPSPFSEPETQAMRDFVLARPNIAGFIDFHNYSELILWPWGYTGQLSPDHAEFAMIGAGMHDSVFAVHGHSYDHGPIYTTIYPAAGVSADWVYGANAPDRFIAAFAIELRDNGQNGFLLPPEEIVPTSEENLQAVIFLADAISAPLGLQLVSEVPASLAPGQSYTVTAQVMPQIEQIATDGVTARFRTDGGAYSSLVMPPIGGDLFEVDLPAVECGDHLDFYVLATGDQGGTVSYPTDAPATVLSVPVGLTFTHSVDELEVATAWAVGDAGDNATTGVWVRVDPAGTSAQPEDDFTPGPGVMCYVTGQGSPGGPPGANDVDGGKTTLFSPVFDVPVDTFTVSYALWFFSNEGGANSDQLAISVSNNAGASWTPVETLNLTSNGWLVHSFRPADVGIAATDQMKLRFIAADLGPASLAEAAVDNLVVSKFGCANGDYNDDNAVDLGDYVAISECMNGPTGSEVSAACAVFNFDLDSDVDMDDYQRFVHAFGQL